MPIRTPRLALVSAIALVAAVAGAGATSLAADGVPHSSPAGDSTPSKAAPPSASPVAQRIGSGPVRRLVWDEIKGKRRGIHLRSATLRGDQVQRARPIYDTEFGFTQQLRLDGHGKRVAFAPCCRSSFATIVVIDVRRGAVLEPLAGQPQFYAVDGIAWSPDGTRLAFEGFSLVDDQPARGIYTIGVDGSDLQTVLAPQPFGDESVEFGTLAWSAQGILYPDVRDLELIVPGAEPRVIADEVESIQLSGNGRWLFTVRTDRDGRSLWRSRPDFTGATKVKGLGDGTGTVFLPDVVPDRRGRNLLGVDGVDTSVLRTWRLDQPLTQSDVVHGVTGSPDVATWY